MSRQLDIPDPNRGSFSCPGWFGGVHPFDRLRPVSAEHRFELPHQRRPLFELGRAVRPPRSASTAEVAEVRNPKLSPRSRSTMRLFSSLISTCSLPNSSRSRFSTAPISHSHVADRRQSRLPVVSESRIFDIGVLAITSGLPRSLQHPIHLIEVDITEQGGDYAALWNALLARSFQHDLQQMPDVRVINPLCHFL